MQVRSSDCKVLGSTLKAEVLSSEQLTKILRDGTLNINLDGVEAAREVIEMSRTVAQMVVELYGLKPSPPSERVVI